MNVHAGGDTEREIKLSDLPLQMLPTGLQWTRKPTRDEWRAAQYLLQGHKAAHAWNVGDWWNSGIRFFGEDEAVQMLDEYSPGTVTNYGSLCNKFTTPQLRGYTTHVSYYQELQRLPLDRAEKMLQAVAASRAPGHSRLERADVKAFVKQQSRRCPECKNRFTVMLAIPEEAPTLWVCQNAECEHELPYAAVPGPQRVRVTARVVDGSLHLLEPLPTWTEGATFAFTLVEGKAA